MSGFYDSMKNIAGSLLTQFGQSIVLRRTSEGTFDPISGENIGSIVTNYTCQAVVSPYKARRVDGTIIKVGDVEVTISGSSLSVVPSQSTDDLIFGGETYKIVNFEKVSPAGTDILYIAQARRGQ